VALQSVKLGNSCCKDCVEIIPISFRRLLFLPKYLLGIHTVERIFASQHLITDDIRCAFNVIVDFSLN